MCKEVLDSEFNQEAIWDEMVPNFTYSKKC